MKRTIALATAVLLALTGYALAGDPAGKTYGDGVKLHDAIPIASLLESPEDYVDKPVRIDGVITGVCKKRGCWMKISDPDSGDGVRIKVEDGVIVFPYDAMGSKASAEGVFEAIEVESEEETHQGEDHSNCTAGAHKKNNVFYQIRGTGAVIYSGS
jgi:hypothetical protein